MRGDSVVVVGSRHTRHGRHARYNKSGGRDRRVRCGMSPVTVTGAWWSYAARGAAPRLGGGVCSYGGCRSGGRRGDPGGRDRRPGGFRDLVTAAVDGTGRDVWG